MKKVIVVCLLAFLGTTSLNAQNMLDNIGLPSTTTARIYSVRKLSSSYTGYAIRVINSSNNAEADVNFDTFDKISDNSNATITVVGSSSFTIGQVVNFSTFYNGATVYVKTWYDQSGNGIDATQSAASSQPKIVNAGTLNTRNGYALITFDGINDYLTAAAHTTAFNNTIGGSLVTLGSTLQTTKPPRVSPWQGLATQGRDGSSGFWGIEVDNNNKWRAGTRKGSYFEIGSNVSCTTFVSASLIQTATDSTRFYVGGTKIGTTLGRDLSNTNSFSIGYTKVSDEYWSGPIAEVILLPTGINNSIRQLIENSQNSIIANCNTPTSSSTNLSICPNLLPYAWNGVTFNSAGSKIAHLTNAAGCDSAATLNLIVKSTSTSNTNLSICPSELPYNWNGLTFTTAGSQTYHTANAVGCDSAATLNLSVGGARTSSTTVVNCGSYTWNGTTYTVSGTYNKLFTGTVGCDSIATLSLTIINSLPPITGANAVCAGSTTQLTNAVSGGVWYTQATSQANINAATGLLTGTNAGAIVVEYRKSGCASVTKSFTVNAIPSVPTVAYAPGTPNPQLGAPTGGFCVGKVFTVVGTPNTPAGAWTSTGVVSVTSGGVVTINAAGAGSVKYTYTNSNGCSNSRTMSGNGFTCASRGVTINEKLETTNEFSIYPNPARSFISLNIETLIGSGTVIITDLYGKQVKQQPLSMGANTIDVSKLSKGMYFVSMITSEGKTTSKLVVE